MNVISTIEQLEELYGHPGESSTVKEAAWITPQYRTLIEASPFVALATAGPEGLDCSPRGDAGQAVRIADERTVLMPDRRGNNRCDSLRNIVRDSRVGLLFLIPGSGTTMRLNGLAHLSVEPELLASFAVKGQAPRSVIVIEIQTVFFQCARALLRSRLWAADAQISRDALPSTGTMVADLSQNAIDGAAYDRELPERIRTTLY